MVKRKNPKGPPDIGQGKRGEEGYLGYLLHQAAHVYRNRADKVLAELGITTPQFTVMTMLAAYPELSGAGIARLAFVTPQTVSVVVANLEKRGAISRRPHPVHGRIQNLDLTDDGRALLKAARTRMHALERALTAGISDDEERVVRRWLVQTAVADAG